jgi:hypothetical protein
MEVEKDRPAVREAGSEGVRKHRKHIVSIVEWLRAPL